MALEKATLQKLTAAKNPQPDGDPIPVQFNPASMKLTLTNEIEGGEVRGRQRRQFLGKSSTELSFDLHFDTADEGTTGTPRSVRERTAQIERFVVPAKDPNDANKRLSPPKVRFSWGDLVIDGIISSVAVDFDFFASDGKPLRARIAVTIKEQDARYEIAQSQEGKDTSAPAAAGSNGGGNKNTGPGSAGGGKNAPDTNRTAEALSGESAADFARRHGLDPTAWRGFAKELENPLSLPAGLPIDFHTGLSLSVGLGVTVGVEAAANVNVEARLGLAPGGEAPSGFALSAAGGVAAAVQTATAVKAEAAANEQRSAFAAPGAPSAAAESTSSASGAVSAAVRAGDTTRNKFDPRAATFGFGVPLRPRFAPARDAQDADAPEQSRAGLPAWIGLPPIPEARRRGRGCHCKGRCGCGCGGRR